MHTSYAELPMVMHVEDLATLLDIGRNAAYELVRSGKIASLRIGRTIRIPREAVINYLTSIAQ